MGLAFLIAFAAFLINGHQRRAPQEGAAVQDAPETRRAAARQGAAGDGRDRGRARRLGEDHLPGAGGGDRDRRLPLQRQGPALDDRLDPRPVDADRGGYWYLRAAIKTGGNPIPITKFGPLHLPVPDQMPLDPRPRFAVAHYLTDADDLPTLVLPPVGERARPALAADPDHRRRRRGLHRLALEQQDPAGDRRRGAAHRGRLRLHAAHRGGPGRLADRLLHQHPLPDPGADPGDGDAADRAAAAGARPARRRSR